MTKPPADQDTKNNGKPKQKKAERRERLGAALRDNLLKRKQQSRTRASDGGKEPAPVKE